MARAMINPHTWSHLYGFDDNETHSPGTVSLSIRADPYNIITKFYVIDMESKHNVILKRPWIHMMKAIPSNYHQLIQYPTPTGITNIRGDQAMSCTISAMPGRSYAGCRRLATWPPAVIPLRKRSKNGL